MTLQSAKALVSVLSSDAKAGYTAVKQYNPDVDATWLARHGFSDEDARQLAISGTSRHPLVGLLRSSQGSSLTPVDYESF